MRGGGDGDIIIYSLELKSIAYMKSLDLQLRALNQPDTTNHIGSDKPVTRCLYLLF